MSRFLMFLLKSLIVIYSVGVCAQNSKLFTKVSASKSGLSFNNTIKDDKEKNILIYSNFYGGAGVGVGDFNNDGLEDIFFAGNIVEDKLYLNEGRLTFKDISKKAGLINDGGWSTGVTIADVNNDGFDDIYVSRELFDHKPELRRNLLYINNGDLTFTELAEKYGVANRGRTRHATFLDYNKDGFLDLFLLTQPPNPGSYSEFFGSTLLKPEFHLVLYKNDGKGKFIEVTQEAGVNMTGFPNAVSASDFNNDGWTDLYVANDFYAPDFLFINNQDGSFTNIGNQALNHMSYYSMGVDVSDINNDGFLDVFVVDMVAEDNFRLKANMSGMNPNAFWKVVKDGGHYQYMFNNFHLNNGNNTFSDIAQITGMAATDWSWANLIADFDNDGHKDVYITNGLLRDIRNTDADKKVGKHIIEVANKWVKENPQGGDISIWDILDLDETLSLLPSQPIKNYAYRNLSNLNFSETSESWGLDDESFSNGAAYADFDNDGDLDIVVNNINKTAFLYRNNLTNKNFLRINLKSKNNRPVLGSRVEIRVNGEKQFFETTNVRGIYSTSEDIVHFGLGQTLEVDSLKVIWPNRKVTILEGVKANQELTLYLEDASEELHNKSNEHQMFNDITSTAALKHKHIENIFNDYDFQVLLPHKLSQFGPALAVADVNNDGFDDVFIGGAANKEATLYTYKDNAFVKSNELLWQNEKEYEDIDASFIDINSDGFLDLYVVSGGNEFEANNKTYADRLYLNNGKGIFTKTTIKDLPSISGSVVKANDFDKDGDLDVFVGGRLSPRDYPRPTSSFILKNDEGELINETNTIAKELNDIGMVTDAVWSDYDQDGWTDLIVVGEWMPITLFKNNKGILKKQSIEDLEATKGWWFSIEQGDFDNDGDLDFIAGNLGLNYKYKTATDNPFDVYYHDFDNNGNLDIVLGYYQENKHYPLRGFSCSSQQVPSLKKTFKKYDVFASLELKDVYGEDKLREALHYKTDTFASVFIENKGKGNFNVTSLPNMAQLSNINDFVIDDFNKDGNLDVLCVGNLFVSEIETTRNDAGHGLVLLGDGKNNFKSLHFLESGIFCNKDAKKAKLLSYKNQKLLLVANNNDILQVFKVIKN
ncbi:FG-GAP-like repeat-containing protein [Snuella sedimenti]|uniref:VCBS repeat-containing protein n=1 Tax=Snuella sedimenti TaxID=2798802 RepID=A0A8J7LME6_9FLAO|nr:FG-GAP-like repeat-containing protein [Snuella sedimenti]MBJ6367434.1 VCBS repeat-containing protein [Snuella sedimenti]